MNQIDLHNKTIVISRTDSIGDVILTLPLCSWIKEQFPSSKVVFLGRNYTKPILECYEHIDRIECWNDHEKKPLEKQIKFIRSLNADVFLHIFPNKQIAKAVKKVKVEYRVGTSHRLFHRFTCNIRPNFTRKNSSFHEGQLNFELLKPFGVNKLPSLEELAERISSFKPNTILPEPFEKMIDFDKKNIILHPKSQGSAVEWPIEKYVDLALKLEKEGFDIYFSGTEKEGKLFRKELPKSDHIYDISGRMNLTEFIAFIDKADALVACSTGPLHIAAALNKRAVGIYTNKRPMHPGRWAPLGKNVIAITNKATKESNNAISPVKEIKGIQVEDIFETLVGEV
ncbi:MAG: glycosyltransferase family 9 protein [Brumimicrobium sp.]